MASRRNKENRPARAESEESPLDRLRARAEALDLDSLARSLLAHLSAFLELMDAHGIPGEGGIIVESVYDAIALSDAHETLEAAFTHAQLELIAHHAKPQPNNPNAFSWHIGRGGVSPHIGGAIEKVMRAVGPRPARFKKSGTAGTPAPAPTPARPTFVAGDIIPSAKVELLRSAQRILASVLGAPVALQESPALLPQGRSSWADTTAQGAPLRGWDAICRSLGVANTRDKQRSLKSENTRTGGPIRYVARRPEVDAGKLKVWIQGIEERARINAQHHDSERSVVRELSERGGVRLQDKNMHAERRPNARGKARPAPGG